MVTFSIIQSLTICLQWREPPQELALIQTLTRNSTNTMTVVFLQLSLVKGCVTVTTDAKPFTIKTKLKIVLKECVPRSFPDYL